MKNPNILINLRIKHNKSQQFIANLLDVTLKTYKYYELNIYQMKLSKLSILATFYNVSLDYLTGLSKFKNPNLPSINYTKLQYNLIYYRIFYNIPKKDLTIITYHSRPTIDKYEKTPTSVSVLYLYLYAKHFNLSLDYMCGRTTKKEIL